MARPVMEQEDAEEPERDPQQEGQPDATEGKNIVDYNANVDCEGSEPRNEPVAQDQSEVNPDAE